MCGHSTRFPGRGADVTPISPLCSSDFILVISHAFRCDFVSQGRLVLRTRTWQFQETMRDCAALPGTPHIIYFRRRRTPIRARKLTATPCRLPCRFIQPGPRSLDRGGVSSGACLSPNDIFASGSEGPHTTGYGATAGDTLICRQ